MRPADLVAGAASAAPKRIKPMTLKLTPAPVRIKPMTLKLTPATLKLTPALR
jgi:hypothetical protein